MLLLAVGVSEPAQGGPRESLRTCVEKFATLAGEFGPVKATREFLARRGLLPYKYGDEQPFIDEVPAIDQSHWMLFGMNYGRARRKFLKAMSGPMWERAGQEVDYGTFVEKPEGLAGKVISGLLVEEPQFLKSGRVRSITGKVISVDVAKQDKQGHALRFNLRILTPDGVQTVHLPGIKEMHVLNLEVDGLIKKVLLGMKLGAESTWLEFVKYANEVVDKPIRLLVKPRDLREEEQYPLGGFLRKETTDHGKVYWVFHPVQFLSYLANVEGRKLLRKMGRELPPENSTYFLVPSVLRGLNYQLYIKGMSALINLAGRAYHQKYGLSEKYQELFNQPLQPSALVDMAVKTLSFLAIYYVINEQNDDALVEKRRQILEEHEDKWLAAIESDPFLKEVRRKLAAGEYPSGEDKRAAVEEAFLRLNALENYYYFMEELHDPNDPDGSLEMLMNDEHVSLLFPELKHLKEAGPRSDEGLEVPPDQQAPASREELRRVMDVNHRFFRKRPLLTAIARSPEEVHRMLAHPDKRHREVIRTAYNEIVNDSYNQALIALHAAGKIDSARLEALLFENAEWERRFSQWEVFGARRFVPGPEGDRRQVDLETLRQMRLQELEEDGAVDELGEASMTPPESFDARHLISRYGGDLTKIHVLRQTSPYLKRLGAVNDYVMGAAEGRYRSQLNGQGSRFTNLMTQEGSVATQVARQGWLSDTLTVAGRAVIYYDLANRYWQWQNVERDVLATLDNPYLHEKADADQGVPSAAVLDQLRRQYQSSEASWEELARSSGNPYLKRLIAE